MMKKDVSFLPLRSDLVLIYAPFHGITTLVNRPFAGLVSRCLADETGAVPENAEWIAELRKPGKRPERYSGEPDPLFLGLIPTRSCMMQCAYCDFVSLKNHPLMSFDVIRKASDGYAEVLRKKESAVWNMHFFGGEPFAAFKEVVFAVNYARKKAGELGIPTHFEVTTNGYYSGEKARWIAENIDTVVLSLDGFPKIQDRHRPGPGGSESFRTVCRSADIFSRGSCELVIRSCVSAENAETLGEWAAFLAERWFPEAVCLEPMIESPMAKQNGLTPPDPDIFARNWTQAHRMLRSEKIRLVYSSGDISALNNSLCPMGRDAFIVNPEGELGSCWQLSENRPSSGNTLHFGKVDTSGLHVDPGLLEEQREHCEQTRELCRGCFCYAHCAGGCAVNKGRCGDFCRMTRTLTLWQLLEGLGYGALADELLADGKFLDRLCAETDFRGDSAAALYQDDRASGLFAAAGNGQVRSSFRPKNIPLSLSDDPRRGWIRDGSRVILADTDGDFVKVLTGDESLRFQLDHSGMNACDVQAVYSALCNGVS